MSDCVVNPEALKYNTTKRHKHRYEYIDEYRRGVNSASPLWLSSSLALLFIDTYPRPSPAT